MPLCLTITSYHKLTPGQCSQQQLGEGSLTIGRGPDNDWVLPDPERLVSSRHCSIQFMDGAYYLTDLSTNGVLLVQSGLRLRRGSSERLQDGEVIRLGEYDLLAQITLPQVASPELVNNPPAGDPFSSFDALLNRQAAAVAPAADPGAARASVAAHFQGGSPLDTKPDLFDFLNPPPAAPPAVPDHLPAERHDFRPPTPQPQPSPAAPAITAADASVIPADWDPFAELIGAPSGAPAAVPTPAIDPLFAPFPDSPVASAATPEPPQDPWASLAKPEPTPPVAERRPAPEPAPEAPAQRPPSSPPQGDLLQAFLRGAGVAQLRVEPADAEAQMEAIGRGYRQTVEGLIEVLRARASLKGEFRMQQTSIQPVQNNPLKFAPNVDEALLLLLRSGNQAFMAPDQAMAESFDDLKAHQLAVMAGVQAAIRHLLQRFEPAALEARFGKPSGLSGLLPGARQAQHWENFTELYASILREAEDDFQDLFGREFSRAYEEHSARLRRP